MQYPNLGLSEEIYLSIFEDEAVLYFNIIQNKMNSVAF